MIKLENPSAVAIKANTISNIVYNLTMIDIKTSLLTPGAIAFDGNTLTNFKSSTSDVYWMTIITEV